MPVITNTSPVIMLAKIGRLKLLKELYNEVIIPPSVKIEAVDSGKELGAEDAIEIENAIKDGWIIVSKMNKKQTRFAQKLVSEINIGIGEAEALALAKDKNLLIVLDDKESRALAKSWGLAKSITDWKKEYASKLYSENKITLERAAMQAGVSVREIMEFLKARKIPVQYDLEDLEDDMKNFYRRIGK